VAQLSATAFSAKERIMSHQKLRLDKWLWTARLFKTRALAHFAILQGKVLIYGQKTKPSREAKIGLCFTLTQAGLMRTLMITGVATQRGNATLAQTLYTETAQSLAAKARRDQLNPVAPKPEKSPDKRARKQLRQIRHGLAPDDT
jgi:ribosome-associated heat shock protein Hsp15